MTILGPLVSGSWSLLSNALVLHGAECCENMELQHISLFAEKVRQSASESVTHFTNVYNDAGNIVLFSVYKMLTAVTACEI